MTVFSGMLIATFLACPARSPCCTSRWRRSPAAKQCRRPRTSRRHPRFPITERKHEHAPARAPARSWRLPALAAVIVSGCRVGPEYKRPEIAAAGRLPRRRRRRPSRVAGRRPVVAGLRGCGPAGADPRRDRLQPRPAARRRAGQEARALCGRREIVPLSRHRPERGLHWVTRSRGTRSRRARCRRRRSHLQQHRSHGRHGVGDGPVRPASAVNNEAAFARYLRPRRAGAPCWSRWWATSRPSYFLLRELDLQLEVARRTLALNDQTVGTTGPSRGRRVQPPRSGTGRAPTVR